MLPVEARSSRWATGNPVSIPTKPTLPSSCPSTAPKASARSSNSSTCPPP